MNYSAAICCVVRNCEKTIENVLKNMTKIGQTIFKNYIIIIVYDYSIDNTLTVIKKYIDNMQNTVPNKIILYINDAPLTTIRTINIGNARNICLNIIKKLQLHLNSWEYFIMMDGDEINAGPINLDILQKHLSNENTKQWDALSFNRTPYYDTWALSIYPLVFSKLHFKNGHQLWTNYINNIIKSVINSNTYIPVFSAFNGFAIYKMPLFIDCTYDGRFNYQYIPKPWIAENIKVAGPILPNAPNEKGDCEHRHFHYQAIIKNRAKIKITTDILFPGPGLGPHMNHKNDTQ